MPREIEERIGRILAAWVVAVTRRPWAVTLGILAATAATMFYAGENLGIRGDTESLFSSDLPFRRAELRYHEAFPGQYETMFVVVEAVTPERAGEAATLLTKRLQAEPTFFHSAYLPGGGEFFERNAFLYLDTDELEDLADRLAEVQPYMAELGRDGTVRGLSSMMGRGVRAVRDGEVGGSRMVPIFERFDAALHAEIEGDDFQLSWAEVIAGAAFDVDARRRLLLVQPVLNHRDLQPAKQSILAVRRIAEELGLTEAGGARVRITGDAALSYDEMDVVRGQAAAAGLASFVLVGIILFAALRSLRLVLSTLLTLLVGLIFTAGFSAVAIGHLNLISVTFAVLFIGLGVDFGIHLCMRYRELLGEGRAHGDALIETARDVGSSLFLCAATTAVGFFAFVPTDFVGVAELGLIAGAGMFISLFCTLTLLPALLSLPPVPSGGTRGPRPNWGQNGLAALPLRHPRAVRAVALALGLGAIVFLPQARFDNNPLRVRDPSSESVQTFADLLERGGSSPWSLNAVAPDLETAEALAEELSALDVVKRVVTVADFVPSDQEEKLGIIEDVAMFLGPLPGSDGAVPAPSLGEQVAALRKLEVEIGRLLDEDASLELEPAAAALHATLGNFRRALLERDEPQAAMERLQASVVGSLPEQLRILDTALSAGKVTLENLPDALVDHMITADGRVRVQIFPQADLNDHAALAAFVDGVRGVAPEVSGSASEIVESGRAVVRALRQALVSAVIVMTLILWFLWRRLDDTALVLVPLGLAATLTVAAAVIAGIPFNFADVIVLPLLLGIGVDSGIHLVHRARMAGGRQVNLLGTSTARAVAFSALTTIGSFGTLGFATHMGLATLGRLLTLGVGFAILCTLVVLPSLLPLRAPRERTLGEPSEGVGVDPTRA